MPGTAAGVAVRQWCAACPMDDVHGQWVEIENHPHPLPDVRATVYLYEPAHDGQAEKWAAYLPLWLDEIPEGADSFWFGWQEFPTQQEAMEYGRRITIDDHERRHGAAENRSER